MIANFNHTVLQGKYDLCKTVEFGRSSEHEVSVTVLQTGIDAQKLKIIFFGT